MSRPNWMSDQTARMFNFANNPITIAGIAVTTVSAIMIIILALAQMGGAIDNPYVASFAFLVMPGIFIAGLLIIPIGMLRRRRALIRSGATDEEMTAFPRLDFNDPGLRRAGTLVLGLTALNGIILGSAGYFGVHYMDSPTFCGEVCHTVMLPEYTAYQGSPHSRVHCVQCHIGPGASWFVKSKLDGLRQVWKTTWNTYERPVPSPVTTLRPAQQTCEQCHWPSKHHGDKVRVLARFADDEANTAAYSVMLLKTGGGDLDSGRHGGIHWWHIYGDNKIRYLATDERRQEIAWVELVTPDGSTYVYTNDGAEPPSPETIAAEARTMDCIDCHNRPTHLFLPPAKAVDEVLAALPDLRELPYYKREVVKAVGQKYPSNREGADAVRTAIVSYYRAGHPEVAAGKKALVERGAEEAARVYQRAFFPEMHTDWQTHPNNIGHEDFPGCFRCHDGSKATADGERMIPVDCENCHAFLAEDVATLPDLERLRLALAH